MDTLSVELQIIDEGANAKLINFERRAENAASNINRAGKKINFGRAVESDLEKAEKKISDVASKFDSLGLGTFGKSSLAIGAAIGGTTVALSKFVDVSRQAIDISIASQRSNRLLAASATEAGLAYADLAEKNKKFAGLNALSDTAAASTTARITQLARTAGRPQDIDKLSTAFSDLGAARGIAPKDLETLIGTILSGQDEGLNRLGLPDPSKIYAAYAQSIGKTADQLSQMEKVQAATNAVVEKSQIFKGAAQSRLNSLEGQVETLNARWENFTTTLSNNFAQSREVNQGLTTLSDLMKQISYDTDDLQKKLSQGVAPNKLAADTAESFKNFDRFKEIAGFIAKGALFSPSLTLDAPKRGYDFFNDTENDLRKQEIQQRLNAQLLADALQKKSAEDQKKNLDEILAKEKERQEVIKKQAELSALFTNPRTSTFEISSKLQELKNGNFFKKAGDLSDADTKKVIDEGERELAQRTTRSYQLILQSENKNLNELRRGLASIANDPNLFFEQRESLTASFNQKIKEVSKSLLDLKDVFRDALVSSAATDNPLVKTMSDIETATDRAQKKFGAFGSDVVKTIADIEKANLTKALNLQTFENGSEALKFRQEALKLAATPETQFADYQRALDRVEKKTDFLAKIYDFDKRIKESDFYAKQFNPNDPKTFNESRFSFAQTDRFSELAGNRKRGESFEDFEKRRKEAIDIGIKTFDAITDVKKFSEFSLEGTGVLGKGIIADKILEAIPKREDLLKQLESPYVATRENAQFLLSSQSNALLNKKEAEQQKLRDFLANQQFQQFGKQFANEQIGFINDSNLTDAQKAQHRLSVTDALGNDLDPRLKQQRIQDFVKVADEKDKLAKEAMQIAKDTRDLVSSIVNQLAGKGIKIDGGGSNETPAVNVNVEVKDSPTSRSTVTRANPSDTAKQMDLSGTYFEQSQK